MGSLRWFVCATLALAGCIEPQLQRCGDLLCSVDSVCLPSGRCVSQDSVTACEGMADGTTCQTTLFTGSCQEGVCTAPNCGDGIVAGSEQCDGAVSGVDCVDYGFDLGIPTCSDRCALDVVGRCTRFGWTRLLSVPISYAWTDGTRFAVVDIDETAAAIYVGGQLQVEVKADPGEFFSGVTGNATSVVTWSGARVLRSTGGAFVDIDLSTIDAAISDVQITEDGTLYLGVFGSGCDVYRAETVGYTLVRSTTENCRIMHWAEGQLYLGLEDGSVLRYSPTTSDWAVLFNAAAPIRSIAVRAGVVYAGTSNAGAVRFENGVATPFDLDSVPQIVTLPSGIYVGGGLNSELARYEVLDFPDAFTAPIGGYLFGDGTNLYIYGNGIYVFTGMQYAMRPGVGLGTTDQALFDDGAIAISMFASVFTQDSYTTWIERNPGIPARRIAGYGVHDFYVADTDSLRYFDGSSFAMIALPTGTTDIEDLAWDEATSTLFVVGRSQLGLARVGSTWMTLTPPTGTAGCTLTALARQSTAVYASGICGSQGVIWSLGGGMTWTEIHRGPFSLLAIAVDSQDNVYAAGQSGIVKRIGGLWSADANVRGSSISATSPTDIWVAGGPQEVVHFDGTAWSRLRVVGASSPRVIATPRAVYLAGTSTPVLLR